MQAKRDINAERQLLPATAANWLNSENGRQTVVEAVAKSLQAVESLNQARQVKPEQMHEPITL